MLLLLLQSNNQAATELSIAHCGNGISRGLLLQTRNPADFTSVAALMEIVGGQSYGTVVCMNSLMRPRWRLSRDFADAAGGVGCG